jgi:hypothetical protein
MRLEKCFLKCGRMQNSKTHSKSYTLFTEYCVMLSNLKNDKQTFDLKLKMFDKDMNAIYPTFNLFKDGFC